MNSLWRTRQRSCPKENRPRWALRDREGMLTRSGRRAGQGKIIQSARRGFLSSAIRLAWKSPLPSRATSGTRRRSKFPMKPLPDFVARASQIAKPKTRSWSCAAPAVAARSPQHAPSGFMRFQHH